MSHSEVAGTSGTTVPTRPAECRQLERPGRRGRKRILLGVAAWTASVLGACRVPDLPHSIAGTSSSDAVFIYMDPDGADDQDGSAPGRSIRTLARAQEIVEQVSRDSTRNVEIRIGSGRYSGQTVVWTVTVPGKEIVFSPAGEGTPVFDGRGLAPGPEGRLSRIWFRLDKERGARTRLVFRGLHVRNYEMAILLRGDRSAEEGWNGGNVIEGCEFDSIGDVSDPHRLRWSPAAVDLVNSRHNLIRGNLFRNVVNSRRSEERLIHGIYLAHGSSHNRIVGNVFQNVSGDPVRVRDRSSHNFIVANLFRDSGYRGAVVEWLCEGAGCTSRRRECPSWENRVEGNILQGAGDRNLVFTGVLVDGGRVEGCNDVGPGTARFHEAGNFLVEDTSW